MSITSTRCRSSQTRLKLPKSLYFSFEAKRDFRRAPKWINQTRRKDRHAKKHLTERTAFASGKTGTWTPQVPLRSSLCEILIYIKGYLWPFLTNVKQPSVAAAVGQVRPACCPIAFISLLLQKLPSHQYLPGRYVETSEKSVDILASIC